MDFLIIFLYILAIGTGSAVMSTVSSETTTEALTGTSTVFTTPQTDITTTVEIATCTPFPDKPVVVADHVQSTSLFINWTQPCRPNGIITGYNVRAIANESYTVPGCNITESNEIIDQTNNITLYYNFTGLLPWTTYRLCVSANTSVGRSDETCIYKQTSEGDPEKVTLVKVDDVQSTSIFINWSQSCRPNGIITGYNVRAIANESYTVPGCNITESNEIIDQTNNITLYYNFTGLLPWTTYRLCVSANTSVGRSDETCIYKQTSEGGSGKVAMIDVNHVKSTSLFLNWTHPCRPNGIITGYNVRAIANESYTVPGCNITESNEIIDQTNNITLYYNFTGLLPWTTYRLCVSANTSVGRSDETCIYKQTSEGDPEKVTLVKVDDVQSTSIFINWSQSCRPNGIITGYNVRAIANESYTLPGCNITESNEIIDQTNNITLYYNFTGLLPWTTYRLCVSANTSVGRSDETCIYKQTSEGGSGKVAMIDANHVKSTSLFLNWTHPCRPNGIITGYNVRVKANESYTVPGCNITESNEIIDQTNNITLYYNITGLLPWTTYRLCVSANTSVGIGQEECVHKQTLEDVPGPVSNISIKNTTSHSIEVCWESPCSSNGNITKYSVIRTLDSELKNDTTVDFCYHFGDLLAYRNYNISVIAVTKNFVGKPFFMVVQTLIAVPFKPANVSCNATNSTSIEVIWNKGGYKTGPTNYSVTASDYVNRSNVFNCLTTGYDFTTCVITSLEEYWNYTINVTAITDKGSIVSESCFSLTDEAAPGYLQSFHVEQIQNLSAPRLVNISWAPPSEKEQNGIIRNYYISWTSDNGNNSSLLLASNQSTIVVPVQSNTNYTFAIHALTNAPGKENSTNLFIEPGVPTKPVENASNPSIQQAKTVLRTDPKRQIAVKLIPASFLCNNDNGVPDLWGVIVSSDEKSDGLPYEGEKSGYTTKDPFTTTYVSAIKNEPIKPYRATNNSWTPGICSSSRTSLSTEVFVVGTDATCIQNNYCNGQLSPGRLYRVKLFWCTKTACTETEYSLPISTEKEENEPSLGPIIGGVAGSILAIVVIGVVSLYIWRRQMACFKNKMKKLDEGEDNSGFIVDELEDTRTSRPVKKSDFFTHFQNLSANANLLFSRDYQDLEKLSPRYATSDSELEETRTKNRYTNILPFNKTRVKLVAIEDEPGSDYINANYVPGPVSGREYIATQGPLASTINDFWRMIWEQNVSIIVMLTQCVERGRKKCDCYWPSDKNEALFYGDIVVKLESESHLPDFILRTFNLHLGDIKRNVRHYYYLLWPDMGTPACSDYMIRFVDTVRRDIRPDMTGPMVVHCSAGVGRTGTYITLDSIIRKINAGEQNIDIFGHILSLRHCRVNMVQTESQYVYIHECIRDYLQTGSEPEAEYINSPEHDQIYENVSSSQF